MYSNSFSIARVALRLCRISRSSAGRVGRSGGIDVNVQSLPDIDSRRIAISVSVVAWTSCGHFTPFGRLGELPDVRKRNATVDWWRWPLEKRTAWRGRAGIIGYPIKYFSPVGIFAYVLSSNYAKGTVLSGGYARTINSGSETCFSDAVQPAIKVGLLFRKHPSAFFLIEKNSAEDILLCRILAQPSAWRAG